jgi:hypothetical protein
MSRTFKISGTFKKFADFHTFVAGIGIFCTNAVAMPHRYTVHCTTNLSQQQNVEMYILCTCGMPTALNRFLPIFP